MNMTPENTRIGFIGIGVMGKSMAGHLLKAGYPLHVYTRTREKAQSLCDAGAVWEESVPQMAASCNVILTMVGYPADVEEIYFGASGILENLRPGSCVVDMTTSSPDLAVAIYEAAAARSVSALDAPVSGGDVGARNGTLSIMVGGDQAVFDRMLPLFEIMGENIILQGPAGSGQHTKIANQIAIAAGMIAVCESMAYCSKAGLDPARVLRSIGSGAAGSWSLNNYGPRMIAGDFNPGFYVKHFIKDMTIALESASGLGMQTPGLSLARDLYQKLADNGKADLGTQSLYTLFK